MPSSAPPEVAGPRRQVIVHHHIFKCAGSSVDAILEAAFPGRLAKAELRGAADNEAWIANEVDAVAFSSHQAPLGLVVEGVDILPVVFVREPMARLVSAYGFERRAGLAGSTKRGARLAAEHDFAGWAAARLATPNDTQVRSLQAHRLATLVPGDAPVAERATKALRRLPFVGLVEAFDASIARLRREAARRALAIPETTVRANASGDGASASAVIAALSPNLREELMAANAADMALHQVVSALYTQPPA